MQFHLSDGFYALKLLDRADYSLKGFFPLYPSELTSYHGALDLVSCIIDNHLEGCYTQVIESVDCINEEISDEDKDFECVDCGYCDANIVFDITLSRSVYGDRLLNILSNCLAQCSELHDVMTIDDTVQIFLSEVRSLSSLVKAFNLLSATNKGVHNAEVS